MSYVVYDMPDYTNGDTFPGIQFTITVNGSPLSLDGARIDLIRKKVLSTFTGELVITNAAAGIFTVKEQIISLESGTSSYLIRITLSNGKVKTYIKGNWTIY